jgi:uncharacterized membrane protein
MEIWLVFCAFVFFAPLAVSIVVAAQFAQLKSSVDELRRRLTELESRGMRISPPAATPGAAPPPSPPPVVPPPLPPAVKPIAAAPRVTAPVPLNWESILGVKFFAWIGGFALFLGVVFFVRYAFENNLITPEMRIVTGGIVGMSAVVIGAWTRRYRIPAQSLCVTGILVLYADIYAAHTFYNLISLSVASVLMCMITVGALILATRLDAQSVAWLALIGGFLTPALLWTRQDNPGALFGYITILNGGIAGLAAIKRWNYLVFLAAIGTVITEFIWVADFFGPARADAARIIFLAMEAEFLAVCIARRQAKIEEEWSTFATALAGFATLIFCIVTIEHQERYRPDFIFPILFFGNAGLIALGVKARSALRKEFEAGFFVAGALALTWLAEWVWLGRMLAGDQPLFVVGWYVALLILFAATPYFCGVERFWPWLIGAIAGPLQFWFVYQLVLARFPNDWKGLLPLAFAVPAAVGVVYLVKRQQVALVSADSRLATQGAAVLFFVSLIFPVQFGREWITLGWAVEGIALIALFHWIPNRGLRAVALVVLSAAFVRLALNPAVLEYHPRSRVHIWNWYLYVYGTAAFCFFLGARLFGEPREKNYEGNAAPFLYSLGTILCFLLLNIEIADYFSIGPTLTFSFAGNFARDMTYTIAWAIFAFGLLMVGMIRNVRAVRLSGIGLLSIAFAKLFLHDLDSLSQLYRIGAFLVVAVIAIVASFVYQRFLSPTATKS